MTIDEAIAYEREVANSNKTKATYDDELLKRFCTSKEACIKCAEENEQLAEWLEELKFLKQWKSDIMDEFCKYDVSSFEELVANARNKAIDDFVKEFKRKTPMENCLIDELAEQLKAGVTND